MAGDQGPVIGTTTTTPEEPPPGEDPPVLEEGTGAIRGRVCGPDGEGWVVGAFVWVEHPAGRVEAMTDSDGWFLLENVPTGRQEVNVQKGSFRTTFEVRVKEDEVVELPVDSCLEQGELEIAVVTGNYDNIEAILDRFNLDYDVYNGKTRNGIESFLSDANNMASYDIIFFNCGIHTGWTSDASMVDNIEQFVRGGGSIYASDLAFQVAEEPFPTKIDFQGNDNSLASTGIGNPGSVNARVLDPVMEQALGSNRAEIEFNLGGWAAMISASNETEVLLEGEYRAGFSNHDGPLAVRFSAGDGTVVFTSFHNEAQINFDMALMLQEMVLSL